MRVLYENSGAEDKRIVVDDELHGTDMLRRSPRRDRYPAMVTEFIEEHARG
ncbi:hypothetical protein ACFWQ6_32510 [Streptomyces coelicoflavus]|uniref:hypothetical protein n=1 Tax=Streptomyces coelicoflavus TaxID=285562 RepID=UPI00366294D7